jgi:hypothetical protein
MLQQKEKAARAGTERLISATAGSRPVPSLNFGEVCEAALSSRTSHQAVSYAGVARTASNGFSSVAM